MPVLHRHQQLQASGQIPSGRTSIDGSEGEKEPLWVVDQDYEHPQKAMDFPMAPTGKPDTQQKSKNTLRINTYSKASLHDRYLSSEEEPSPRSDDDIESEVPEEELKHKTPVNVLDDESIDFSSVTESKAEIAVAIPILALGRPKLIDITNLAPMHKRKREIKPYPVHAASFKKHASRDRSEVAERSHSPLSIRSSSQVEAVTEPDTIGATTRPTSSLKRKDSLHMQAPESWLPEEEPLSENEENVPPLPSNRVPSHQYDPSELRSPSLGSVARAKEQALSASAARGPGWKGASRSPSLARKDYNYSRMQPAKKAKMIARGANEREESLALPPFPFEDGLAAA